MSPDDLEVLYYGNPELRKVCAEVTTFDDELVGLAQEMERCMIAERGIGLAAPQVGRTVRMLLADAPGHGGSGVLCLVNPEIVESSREEDKYQEGCLSFPEIFADVKRPVRVRVRYQDLEGREHEVTDDALLARIIQHEIDHLQGVLFIDHLSTIKRRMLGKKLKELSRRASEQRAAARGG